MFDFSIIYGVYLVYGVFDTKTGVPPPAYELNQSESESNPVYDFVEQQLLPECLNKNDELRNKMWVYTPEHQHRFILDRTIFVHSRVYIQLGIYTALEMSVHEFVDRNLKRPAFIARIKRAKLLMNEYEEKFASTQGNADAE